MFKRKFPECIPASLYWFMPWDLTDQRWNGSSVRRGRHLLLQIRKWFNFVLGKTEHYSIWKVITCLSPGSLSWWRYHAQETASPWPKHRFHFWKIVKEWGDIKKNGDEDKIRVEEPEEGHCALSEPLPGLTKGLPHSPRSDQPGHKMVQSKIFPNHQNWNQF